MAAQALRENYNEDYFAANYQQAVRAKPKTEPRKKEEPSLNVVKPEKLTRQERHQQELSVSLRCARAIAVGLVVFALAVCNVLAYVANDNAYREIQALNSQLELKQSEYAKLSAELSAMVSADKVEKTAVEKLGLVKLSNNDWEYINVNTDNRIVLSQAQTK